MALLKKKNSYGQTGLTTEEIVKLLAPTQAPKAKASILERLLAPLQAIGSAPDVIYRTALQGEKPAGGAFGAYAGNIAQGMKTAFTGERGRQLKTTSDILEKSGLISGQDTGSRFMRGALGFAGDIALDPTTYLSFGTTGLAKGTAEGLAKEATERVAQKALTSAETGTLKRFIKVGMVDSAENLLKAKGLETQIGTFRNMLGDAAKYTRNAAGLFDDKVANQIAKELKVQSIAMAPAKKVGAFVTEALKTKSLKETVDALYSLEGGRYSEFARSLADTAVEKGIKNAKEMAFGIGKLKTAPVTNKYAVGVAEALTNPLGSAIGLAGAGVKKFAPKVYDAVTDTARKVFSNTASARAANIGGAQEAFRSLDTKLQSLPRKLEAEMGTFLPTWDKLVPEEKARFWSMVEQVPKEIKQGDMAGELAQKWKSFNLPLRDEAVLRNILEGNKEVLPLEWSNLAKAVTESAPGEAPITRQVDMFTPEQQRILQAQGLTTPEQVYQFLKDPVNKRSYSGSGTDALYENLRATLRMAPEELSSVTSRLGKAIANKAKEVPTKMIEDYIFHDVKGFRPVYIEKKFGPEGMAWMQSTKEFQNSLKRNGGEFVDSNVIEELLRTRPQMRGGFSSLVQSPTSALKESALAREFPDIATGEAAGVVYNKNAKDVMLQSAVKTTRAIMLDDFIKKLPTVKDDLGRKLFFTAEEADAQYLGKIPASMEKFSIKDVGSFYAPKEAMKILKKYTGEYITDEGTNQMLKGFDLIMNKYVKPWFTARGPGFLAYNIRNALGDFFNMKIAGFKDAANISEGMKVLQFENLAKQQGVEVATKKFGKEIASFYENALNDGILKTSSEQFAEESGVTDRGITNIQQLLKKGESGVKKVGDTWKYITEAGGYLPAREETFRLAMYIDNYKQTGDFTKAANAVKESLFDYGDLTATEQNVFKRVIPFYSYMRKNFEFQLTNIAKQPGKYTAIDHFIKNLQKNAGADVSEEEWNAMPGWMKSSTSFPIAKKDGNIVALSGFGLPTEAINSVVGTDLSSTVQKYISQSNPLLKYLIEKGTGFDTFTGKEIKGQQYGGRYEKFPQFIKDLIGYKETTGYTRTGEAFQRKTVNPETVHALNAFPFTSSLMTAYKRGAEVPSDPTNLLNMLSGARVYTRNIDQESEARIREQNQALYDFLLQQGYGTMYQGFSIPKELRSDLLSKYGPQQ